MITEFVIYLLAFIIGFGAGQIIFLISKFITDKLFEER